jgi:glycosyltransferase involved in cell wall biosynthesis
MAQGVDPKCAVLLNGVDPDQFRPRPKTGYLHRELQIEARAKLVAVVGQLGLRKGTEIAIAAAADVVAQVPGIHWLIVGERSSDKAESREFEAKLHAMANQSPLRDRIHFLGQRRDMHDLLNECELLAHAARQEPLGRVLLESAASGLAVVATDVGGTREIFPSEDDGALLVPADDSPRLANAAIELLTDNQRRKKIAAGGRRRATRHFDIRQASAGLIELYQSVLM